VFFARRWQVKLRVALIVLVIALLTPLVLSPAVSAAPPAAGDVYYTIRYGDTLTRIARLYGVTVNAIVLANGITNPNYIRAGQRLLIPTSISTACSYQIYTVQRGDTLSAISRKFGVSVWSLVNTNHLRSANLIFAGQRLVIPKAGFTIDSPVANSILNGNVHVTGQAAAFENQIAVEVRTASGAVLARGTAMITGVEMGQTGPYAIDLSWTRPVRSTAGRVVVFDTSPRDGSIISQVCVDVTIQGTN